jgi:hypothetical protein
MLFTAYYIATALFTAAMSVMWSRRWGVNLLIKLSAFALCIASILMLLREQGFLVQI